MVTCLKGVLASALSCSALALGVMCAGNARADVISYDKSLASPDTTGSGATNLSWYNGSGNSGAQGGWTISTNDGIEVGLRAKLRQGSEIDSPGSNNYV